MVHHHPEDEHEVLSLKKVLASTLSVKVMVGNKQLRKLAHAIYRDLFQLHKLKISLEKLKILIFCPKHRLWGDAVLRSTHNLCFGSKERKIDMTLHSPVLLL